VGTDLGPPDAGHEVSTLARAKEISELGYRPEGVERLSLTLCPHSQDGNICPLFRKAKEAAFPITCEYASAYVCAYIKSEYYEE
jgi:hypothetical protein